jgi:D-alanyl-D-alanine endopeptidase (penicillin-binding protein 7)
VAAGAVYWRIAGGPGAEAGKPQAQVAAGTQLPAPAASAAPAAPATETTAAVETDPIAGAPAVEVAPSVEEAPVLPLDKPESFGRRAGLHKTKDSLHLTASAALVVDPDKGEVLYRKNDEAVLPIASLTKLMMALVISEAELPMDEAITITQDDVDEERHSRSRLRVGTVLTRNEALHIALMSSENRAAHALGRTFPAGIDNFVRAMNRKAKVLGMANTTYVEPTGLSNRNQSTAHDLALLVAAASRKPLLAEYSTTRQHQLAMGKGRILQYNNSNRLIKNPRWEITLQKTGYIVEAGWCMVLRTRVSGRNLVMVLLDSGGSISRAGDAERMKRWVAAQADDASKNAGAGERPKTS